MLRLQVRRQPSANDCTVGELFYRIDSTDWVRLCWTLEDTVREVPGQPVVSWKVFGSTAIPRGLFPVTSTFSNRFQKVLPQLMQVPGFAGVRIHGGNTAADTEGCILVAMNHPTAESIRDCAPALDLVMRLLGANGNKATLEVIDNA